MINQIHFSLEEHDLYISFVFQGCGLINFGEMSKNMSTERNTSITHFLYFHSIKISIHDNGHHTQSTVYNKVNMSKYRTTI